MRSCDVFEALNNSLCLFVQIIVTYIYQEKISHIKLWFNSAARHVDVPTGKCLKGPRKYPK